MAGSKEAASYWNEAKVTHLTDSQWGDTGKGKLVDVGAQYADVVVKTNGGANAGHTVNNERGEFKLHLMPSGIFNPDTLSIVGANVVVDPIQFAKEYKELTAQGIEISPENCLLSDEATMVFKWHQVQDGLREKSRGSNKIGTTGRGIGPAYSDRTARTDIRLKHFLKPDFETKFAEQFIRQERLTRFLAGEELLSDLEDEEINDVFKLIEDAKYIKYLDYHLMKEELMEAREIIAPMIANTFAVVDEKRREGKSILGEAGQGQLLDLDFGNSPYVTSSHPGVIGFNLSTGIPIHETERVIGSTKAYMTRVGEGPMPTEQDNNIGQTLLTVGREIGTTTGRDRRCGWFDAVATEYGARTAGITELALTKLDVLDDFEYIDVCVGYEVNGRKINRLTKADDMLNAAPIYERLKGWKQKTTGTNSFAELPLAAREYVSFLEENVGKPVRIVSVGPERNETVYRAS